ncbi:hypothetical protein ACG7TL_008852 [Trametes sanguinea]
MTVKLPSPGPDDEIAGERQADQRLRAMGVHFRAKGKELIVSYLAHGIFGSSVISPMGNNLAVYNFVSGVDVYNVGAGEKSLLKSYKLSKPPQSLHKVQVAYAMNGQRLVCGTTTGDVCVWLVENTQFYQLLNHTDHIVMAVDTMGRDNYLYIATGSAGQGQGTYIMLWRAVTSDAKPGTLYEITTPVGELVESVNNLKAEMRYHFLRLAVAMKAYVLAAFQVIKWLVVVLVTTWSISFVPWGTVTPVILAMCAHLTKLLAMLLPPSFSYAAEAGIDWLKAMVRDWVGVNPVNAVNAVNSATYVNYAYRNTPSDLSDLATRTEGDIAASSTRHKRKLDPSSDGEGNPEITEVPLPTHKKHKASSREESSRASRDISDRSQLEDEVDEDQDTFDKETSTTPTPSTLTERMSNEPVSTAHDHPQMDNAKETTPSAEERRSGSVGTISNSGGSPEPSQQSKGKQPETTSGGASPEGHGVPLTADVLEPVVHAIHTEFGGMRTELNMLGNAVVGIGNAVKLMVEQQGTAFQELRATQERQTASLVELTRPNTRAGPSRSRRQSRGADDMDVDDGFLGDGDGEGVPIPVRSRDAPKRKLQGPPRQQDPKHLAMQKAVRVLTRTLMGRVGQAFDETKVPSVVEVEAFNPSLGPCCTGENFRPDLRSPPHTVWNKSVCDVFVALFIKRKVHPCKDETLIHEAFFSHLGYLHSSYMDQLKTTEDQEAARKAHNRYERKRGLFNRRCDVCASYVGLTRHLYMLQLLGINGMSSDESDVEDGRPVYLVLKKSWRNPEIDAWLRVFDVLYRRSRYMPLNRNPRGANVHIRKLTQKVDDTRQPRTNLPVNAYNPSWLQALTAYDKARLKVDPKPYDFTHEAEINSIVTATNASNPGSAFGLANIYV